MKAMDWTMIVIYLIGAYLVLAGLIQTWSWVFG